MQLQFGTQVKQNPKTFWKFVKSKSKQASIPDVVTNESKCTFNDDLDQAEAFNTEVIPELCNITLSVTEVLNVFKNLDCNKAIGPDNISPYLLKHCCKELCEPLCKMFNLSLKTGTLPSDWCKANVIPIHKSSDSK
jgi:hypothetical protein